jgi:hypothetical protein
MTPTTAAKEGWTWIIGQRKWHFILESGRSICGRFWMPGNPELEQGNDDSADNCVACRRKLEKRNGEKYTFTTTEEKVIAKFSSHDGAHAPCYGKPQEVTLRVVRRNQPLKVGKRTYPAGYITNLSVNGMNWAEYTGDDWQATDPVEAAAYGDTSLGEFMVEEYRMCILSGWTPQ